MATVGERFGLTIPSMDDAPNAGVLFENFRILEEKAVTQEYVESAIGGLSELTSGIKAILGV